MPNFDNPTALDQEAWPLYRESKYSAAALAWARSREAARALGDARAAFKAGVWEAEAWLEHGDLQRALALMLSTLSEVPPEAEAYDHWWAQQCLLDIQLKVRPERARWERLLAGLEALASRQTHPLQDLHFHRGELPFFQRKLERALNHYACGWQAHGGGPGTVRHCFAWKAFLCCVRLGRRQEAESWRQHLSACQSGWEEARAMLKAATLLSSLEAGDRAAVAMCLENGCGWKRFELRGHVFLRGDSLDPLHDPSDPSHPARELARQGRVQSVHDRYDDLLALVDYRLSCLRFTAGLPAVDDLYYRNPDILPGRITPNGSEKFRRQMRLFGISWRRLKRHARRIDDLLECEWRTQEVEARRQRSDSIVAACGDNDSRKAAAL